MRPLKRRIKGAVPMSQQTFAELGVSSAVAGALADRGITTPFAIQRLVIGDVLAGRDVLAKSPTGSGKTLAFAVPIAERLGERRPGRPGSHAGVRPGGETRGSASPRALVLAPTRELAAQIVEQTEPIARSRGLSVTAVYGGVGFDKQIRAVKRAD